MVNVTYTLEISDTESIDTFDSMTHIGFGSGLTVPSQADTILVNELYRTTFESKVKDYVENTYTFIGRVPITQLNSSSISEVGIFDAPSSGNMGARVLSPVVITKTDNEEVLFTLIIKSKTINT